MEARRRARVRLKSGAIDRDGNIYTQQALRDIVAQGTPVNVELTDKNGKVVGSLTDLRFRGNKMVVADLEMGDLTPNQVRQLLGKTAPTISARGRRARRREARGDGSAG